MNGIERLSEMIKGQKDKYLQIIVNHLMLQTEMSEAFLNEEKNLKDMATYIKDLAKKQATNNVAVIEDEVVFQWAKDYFNKSNEELGIKKIEEKNKTETVEKDEITKTLISDNPQNIILLYKTNIFKNLGMYCNLNEYHYKTLEKNISMLKNCDNDLLDRLIMLDYLNERAKVALIF